MDRVVFTKIFANNTAHFRKISFTCEKKKSRKSNAF